MKRRRMNKRKSRKNFRKNATSHTKNFKARPTRGGYRL